MGSSLVLVGARLGQVPLQTVWLKSIFVLATLSATMAWNDWRDRQHDVRKGKTFASENERGFKVFVIVLGVLVASLAVAVLVNDPGCWIAVLGLVTIGCTYNEFRLVPFVPNAIVALGSALPVLFVSATRESVMIFWATAAVIFAREIIKDYEDVDADRGHKWSLPLMIGPWATAVVAGGLMTAAVVLHLVPANAVADLVQVTLVFVACWTAVDVFHQGQSVRLSWPKSVLDIGVAAYLLSVIITGAP